ncbi:MAG: hypothetical protein A2X28_01980 [Elusimicrobia bacterium GWA2_56_46]|nr:MAG: hypothetical protein A2X28_01980 [Elusimicrobia bacterium GWA2_56_46]OGR55502.1 MAG: hypothetical protein A2X39_00985 [Elusimicrobia bacterium GWC2_56_31]
MDLRGRTAFVTGGLGLIGFEVSRALCEAGARTVVCDIVPVNAALKKLKPLSSLGDIRYEKFDITDLHSVENRLKALAKKHGGIHIFVNNAYPRTKDWGAHLPEVKLASWRKNIEMHLNSYAWLSRAACLLMSGKGGNLINFGSIYGVMGPDFTVYEGTTLDNPPAYAAIKGGIINFSRYLASYFGPRGVRVNNICPGGVFDKQNQKFVANYSKKVPMKRMARPDEIASAVLFLASDMSSYVTGQTLMVDGGWSIV